MCWWSTKKMFRFYLLPDNRELKLGQGWEVTRSKDHFLIFTILSSHGIDIHNIDIDDIDIHCHWHPPNECERCILLTDRLCHRWNKLIYRNPQLMARNVRNDQILSPTNQQSDACVPTWPDSLIFWPFLPFLPLQDKKKKDLGNKKPKHCSRVDFASLFTNISYFTPTKFKHL